MTTQHHPAYPSSGAYAGNVSTPSPAMPGQAGSDCGCGGASANPSYYPGSHDALMYQTGPGTGGGGQFQEIGLGGGAYPYSTYGTATGYVQAQPYAPTTFLGLNFRDHQLWKGAILGAAITLLLTSESVQKGLIKGVAKMYGAVQGGVQEIKEKFEDVQAEMRQKSEKE